MPEDPDAPVDLPREVVNRLERFARRIDQLGTDEVFLMASPPLDPEWHADAQTTAEGAAIAYGRKAGLKQARVSGRDWIGQHLSTFHPRAPLGYGMSSFSRSAEARLDLMASFDDAIAAIVAWDVVSDEVRDELLGPWARLAI